MQLQTAVPQGVGAREAPASARALPADLQAFGRRQRLRRTFLPLAVLIDTLILSASFLLAAGGWLSAAAPSSGALLAVLPTYLVVAANNRAYSLSTLLQFGEGARLSAFALAIAAGNVILVIGLLGFERGFSPATFAFPLVFALFGLLLARLAYARFAVRGFGVSAIGEIVICDGVPCPGNHAAITLDAAICGLAPRLDDPGSLDWLGRHLRGADRVIVACPPARRQDWAQALKGAGIRAEVFAGELEPLGAIGLGRFAGRNTVVVAAGPLGFVDRGMKRLLDLAVTLATAPLVLPVMAVVSLAIKFDSPGPILFRQPRMGAGNRIFTVLKFRSMREEYLDPSGLLSTARQDNRLTRVGRFIRRTSIDELPQLFNVLRGEMSLVGPRPHAFGSKAGERYFWDVDASYWHRHAMKPGITGLAQVRGLRGAIERQADLTQRLQADLEYLSDWTVWRDVAILCATARVLIHRNAY